MNFEETNAYSVRAAHCVHLAGLTEDIILKKFWDDLADDWMALHNTLQVAGNASMKRSFAGHKLLGHA